MLLRCTPRGGSRCRSVGSARVRASFMTGLSTEVQPGAYAFGSRSRSERGRGLTRTILPSITCTNSVPVASARSSAGRAPAEEREARARTRLAPVVRAGRSSLGPFREENRNGPSIIVQGPRVDERFVQPFEILQSPLEAAPNNIARHAVTALANPLSHTLDRDLSRA